MSNNETEKTGSEGKSGISRRSFVGTGAVLAAGTMTGILSSCNETQPDTTSPESETPETPETPPGTDEAATPVISTSPVEGMPTAVGDVVIVNQEEVEELLASRGLFFTDITKAIFGSISTGEAFIAKDDPFRFLYRNITNRLEVYVDYTVTEDATFIVNTAYGFKLRTAVIAPPKESVSREQEASDWRCTIDGSDVMKVNDVPLKIAGTNDLFTVNGLRCEQCEHQMLDEETVLNEMSEIEKQLEAK